MQIYIIQLKLIQKQRHKTCLLLRASCLLNSQSCCGYNLKDFVMGYLKNTLNLLNLHPNFGERFEGNSSGGMFRYS